MPLGIGTLQQPNICFNVLSQNMIQNSEKKTQNLKCEITRIS